MEQFSELPPGENPTEKASVWSSTAAPPDCRWTGKQVQEYLNRRKPGQSRYTTQRTEGDLVEIQSGVFEGKTTGTPISMTVFNNDQRSRDYSQIS